MSVNLLGKLASKYRVEVPEAASDETHTPNDDSILKLTTPFLGRFEVEGILTSEFRLSHDEEALILQMVHNEMLVSNLNLFDLFSFDLYEQLASLENLLVQKDYEDIQLGLQWHFARCVESRDETAIVNLSKFLNELRNKVIASNSVKTRSMGLKDNELRAKMSAEMRLIIETLNGRIALFGKFLDSPGAHRLFFSQPFRKLQNCDKIFFDPAAHKVIFEKNLGYILFAYTSLCLLDDRFLQYLGQVENLIRIIKEMQPIKKEFIRGGSCPPPPQADFSSYQAILGIIFNECYQGCIELHNQLTKNYIMMESDRFELSVLSGGTRATAIDDIKLLDSKDPLYALKQVGLFPHHFYLTPPEESLLTELLKESPPDPLLTLIDLLSFALHQRLKNLEETIPPYMKDALLVMRKEISGWSFMMRLGMYRALNSSEFGPVNDYSEKFAFSLKSFREKVGKTLSTFRSKLDSAPARTLSRKAQETILVSQKTVAQKIDQTVTPIVDLWIKLLTVHGYDRIMSTRLVLFPGGKEIGQGPRARSLQTVTDYYLAILDGYDFCVEHAYVKKGIDLGLIRSIERRLRSLSMVNHEHLQNFGAVLAQAMEQQKIALKDIFQDCQQAKQRSSLESKEALFAHLFTVGGIAAVLADLLRLAELECFPEGTVTTDSCFFRFYHNIARIVESRSTPVATQTGISSDVQRILMPLDKFIYSAQFRNLTDLFSKSKNLSEGIFDRLDWIIILLKLDSNGQQKDILNSLFTNALDSLRPLPHQILVDLRAQWGKLSLEELQRVDKAALKETFFQEGLQLLRHILILFDLLTLIGKRPYPTRPSVVPPELANVMDPDGIDDLLEELIEAKKAEAATAVEKKTTKELFSSKAAPIPPSSLELATETAEKVNVATASEVENNTKLRKKKIELTPPSKPEVVQTSAAAAAAAAPVQFDPHELVSLSKHRKLVKRLEEMGFFRSGSGKGSHEKMGLEGVAGALTVPLNPATGTRLAIGQQAARMLEAAATANDMTPNKTVN